MPLLPGCHDCSCDEIIGGASKAVESDASIFVTAAASRNPWAEPPWSAADSCRAADESVSFECQWGETASDRNIQDRKMKAANGPAANFMSITFLS